MNKEQIIKDVISLPREFYTRSDSTMYALLKESGYFEIPDQIRTDDFERILEENDEYIQDWLNLSENKRTESGWFFKKIQSGKYNVGYATRTGASNCTEYAERVKACAAFIKLEIEDIRNS